MILFDFGTRHGDKMTSKSNPTSDIEEALRPMPPP